MFGLPHHFHQITSWSLAQTTPVCFLRMMAHCSPRPTVSVNAGGSIMQRCLAPQLCLLRMLCALFPFPLAVMILTWCRNGTLLTDLANILARVNGSKTLGSDGISATVPRAGGHVLLQHLDDIISTSIFPASFSVPWRGGRLVNLHKKRRPQGLQQLARFVCWRPHGQDYLLCFGSAADSQLREIICRPLSIWCHTSDASYPCFSLASFFSGCYTVAWSFLWICRKPLTSQFARRSWACQRATLRIATWNTFVTLASLRKTFRSFQQRCVIKAVLFTRQESFLLSRDS